MGDIQMKCLFCDNLMEELHYFDEIFGSCSHKEAEISYVAKNNELTFIKFIFNKGMNFNITYIISNAKTNTSQVIYNNKIQDVGFSLFNVTMEDVINKLKMVEVFS